jgi:hypothetical protein
MLASRAEALSAMIVSSRLMSAMLTELYVFELNCREELFALARGESFIGALPDRPPELLESPITLFPTPMTPRQASAVAPGPFR